MNSARKTPSLRYILQKCLDHIDKLECSRSIDDHYEKEFQDLKNFSESLKTNAAFACTEGEKEINRKKNRYKDILPFNVSRVVLNECDSIVGSNYVNANYIRGASGSPAYIASQGPLPNTVNDFWRMVVECEVHVIVMACNAEEAGKHKCEDYWVEREGEERMFGSVEVRLIKANNICPDFLVRTMRIKYINEKGKTEDRTVCQFHYSAWPDHGVPPLVRPLLDMVRLVRDTQASETLPVLVHCSAGCGRTGTICAIDYVWGLLRQGKLTEEFSLFNLVRDMRKQRVAMVQTKEQYVLVHQAVRELFKEQLHIIDSHPYENIDPNGDPLPSVEPIYETLFSNEATLNALYEKQDRNKPESVDIGPLQKKELIRLSEATSPSRRKKSTNTPYSKHEKEAENMSEKNRTANIIKSLDEVDGSPSNSLLRKPKIAKLKALFERSPPSSERAKSKNSLISRSHSLGPGRKPVVAEIFPVVEKKPISEPPIRSGGKLKVPKVITTTSVLTRPVPHVKRSKSLKVAKNTGPPLLSLLQYASADELDDSPSSKTRSTKDSDRLAKSSIQYGMDLRPKEQIMNKRYAEESKLRRSLESLMGDLPPEITWTKDNGDIKERQAVSLKHQFQQWTNVSQKTMNSLACGLGIRERRNSFRRAIHKEEPRVHSDNASVLVDGNFSRGRDMLTVKSQNGEILHPGRGGSSNFIKTQSRTTPEKPVANISPSASSQTSHSHGLQETSQSMRLPSRNRFLTRLKSELQNQPNGPTNLSERKAISTMSEMTKKPEFTNPTKPAASAPYQLRTSKSDASVDKTLSIAKNDSVELVSKNRNFLGWRALRRKSQTVSTNYQGLYLPISDTSAPTSQSSVPSDKKGTNHKKDLLDVKSQQYVAANHSHPSRLISASNKTGIISSASSLSSDNMSDHASKSSPISTTRSDLSSKDLDLSAKLNSMILRDRHRQDVGSESSSSSGTREIYSVLKFRSVEPDLHNGNAKLVTRSKSTSYEIVSHRPQPVAPPRIRRKGSSEYSRHSMYNPTDTAYLNDLSRTRSIDAGNWNGAIGVDLDVVAASMQNQRRSVKEETTPPPPSISQKKQQYF